LRKIILDCDPGIDDALALALACSSPEIELLGVTTTHGNVPLFQTTENALALLEMFGSPAKVYPGASMPLVRNAVHAGAVHGDNGMGGVDLPEHRRKAEDRHAVDYIIETVMAAPGQVSLFHIGPLTNLALAIRLRPELVSSIKEVIVMGGSTGEGNVTCSAEFNMFADPHAARIVLESGANITMFGLDVTHRAIAGNEVFQAIADIDGDVGAIVLRLMRIYAEFYEKAYGWSGPAIHDMCTIAWAIDPGLFRLKSSAMTVDTNDGVNFGRTVVDSLGLTLSSPRVAIAAEVNAEAMFDLFVKRLASKQGGS
jgi:purine nucleosidase